MHFDVFYKKLFLVSVSGFFFFLVAAPFSLLFVCFLIFIADNFIFPTVAHLCATSAALQFFNFDFLIRYFYWISFSCSNNFSFTFFLSLLMLLQGVSILAQVVFYSIIIHLNVWLLFFCYRTKHNQYYRVTLDLALFNRILSPSFCELNSSGFFPLFSIVQCAPL